MYKRAKWPLFKVSVNVPARTLGREDGGGSKLSVVFEFDGPNIDNIGNIRSMWTDKICVFDWTHLSVTSIVCDDSGFGD